MIKQLQESLTRFGLSEKESKVYITLLTHGEQAVETIAQTAKLNRSTAYVQLQKLRDMGLVTSFTRGKKTLFSAESPQNIERILERQKKEIDAQKEELSRLIPDILKLAGQTFDRPSVRIFEGKEGLMTMRHDILEQPITHIKIITSIDQMRLIFTREELRKFTRLREKKKIHSTVIYADSNPPEVYVPYPHQALKEVKKDTFPFASDVYIYGDAVSFATVQPTITGVTILNASTARTMEALFDTMWNRY